MTTETSHGTTHKDVRNWPDVYVNVNNDRGKFTGRVVYKYEA